MLKTGLQTRSNLLYSYIMYYKCNTDYCKNSFKSSVSMISSPFFIVTLTLCPTHHRLIYHPESTSGPHSIQSKDSLLIDDIYKTNKGYAVIYKDINDQEITEWFDD